MLASTPEAGAMFQKTLRKSLSSLAILVVLSSAAWTKVLVMKELSITVSVHNDAGTPFGILLQAESEASRIFRQSGLEIRWLNCSPLSNVPENQAECTTADFPRHLQLRIARRALNLNEFTMGISYLSADGTGCYADIFYERAKLVYETSQVNVATILGHGIAHEIGHLLLGTNSHAPAGLMRARWQPADLASASKGTLLFSTLQSQEMRNKLAPWHAHARDRSPTASARQGD
jgi:hypothetical protein